MDKPSNYSLEVVCRPFQLCTFNLYTPDANAQYEPGNYVSVEDYDSRFQPGFGMPAVRMRGMSTQLPPEEAQLTSSLAHSDIYNSHRLYSRHAATGDAETAIGAANRFLEGHALVGEVAIDADRLGDLGALAMGEQSDLFIPSPALATAMGQLPMQVEAALER